MKEIQLTKGLFAIVDDADYDWLNQWRWYAHKGTRTFYANRRKNTRIFTKPTQMHREIMNAPDDMEVDHIDGNGLNNTRANLRICTHKQNKQNVPKYANNTSGYKGVSIDRKNNKWTARIKANNKYYFLGYFQTPEEAAHAYDEAAKKYFGEFAYTNF